MSHFRFLEHQNLHTQKLQKKLQLLTDDDPLPGRRP